jgi:hypothetical protein
MRIRHLFLALSGLLVVLPGLRAQDPPADPNVEVLTRGPVHEAYANAVTSQPSPGLLAPKQPPDPIEELPPAEKPTGDNVQWIPGYWSWDDDKQDYLWVSGFWRVPPPARTWVPGGWRDTGNGQWQWTGGFWNGASQGDVQYLPPPPAPPMEAAPPPQPGPDYMYAPGNWVYRDTHYVWRPGFWYVYRPGWVYVPAHYAWTPYGYIFVDGYWDYPLRERGVLFTPVYFTAGVYYRPGFVYTPSYVVYDDALYGALFVRPGGGYYFGDYFEARYTSLGYRSWFSVSIGIGARDPYPYRYDPLFVYYRRTYGPTWAVQVNNIYVERATYPDRRPPRTLVQQTTVINNITNNTTIINNNNTTVNNVKNVTMVSHVTKVDKSVVNLTKITPQQQQQAAVAAKETRQVAAQRAATEAQLAKTSGRAGPPLAPRTVKLDLPKTAAAAATPTNPAKAPPPLPQTPAHPATPAPAPAGSHPPVSAAPPPPAKSSPPPGPGSRPQPVPPPSNPPAKGPPPNSPPSKAPPPMPPGAHPMPPGQQQQHPPPPQHQPPPGQRPQPKDRDRDPPDRP